MKHLSNNHPFILLSRELREIAKPLEKFDITCFSYLKNLTNGLQINLSSAPKWIEDYYENRLFESSAFDRKANQHSEGYRLWSSVTCDSEVIRHGRDYFNSDHGITIINKTNDGNEFYFFSGPSTKYDMHNFFINNLNLLQHFLLYFNENFNSQINKLSKSKHLIKQNKNDCDERSSGQGNQVPLQTQELKITKLTVRGLNNETIIFSPQQTKCIKLLLKYNKVSEISAKMNLSKRTIETYLDQIKFKLGLQSKTDLFNILYSFKNIL